MLVLVGVKEASLEMSGMARIGRFENLECFFAPVGRPHFLSFLRKSRPNNTAVREDECSVVGCEYQE